ncbi:MAG: hypothetical protein KAU38_04665 [Desulfobacterales bacterium]|nr:hypothetical protein [Desulfobacterales bacterium]
MSVEGNGCFFYFAANGRIKEFIKAKRGALKGLKRALQKRRHIQDSRKVDDDYVWSLLEGVVID